MTAHGIMFHHFHDDHHPKSQGSVGSELFADILDNIGLDSILPADKWLKRALEGTLDPKDICLTFDDSLRCQYDIALPVLDALNLKGFWFVYSSVFQGHTERLELYRYYRTTCFSDETEFYKEFDHALSLSPWDDEARTALLNFSPQAYLAQHAFYSDGDRQFRFLRDDVLGPKRYFSIMDEMISQSGFDGKALHDHLWMDDGCLKTLHDNGHVVGLHSYSHPTRIERLPKQDQETEFARNADHLESVLGVRPVVMAHPCGSYNDDTLGVLRGLGIRVGFRSDMTAPAKSLLELPRKDQANIVSRM